MGEFRMPSLGADMEQGTLVEWLVQPGQRVHRGDTVAVVETDKADIEVESFEDGIVERLIVEPHTTVAVGAPLAVFSIAGAPGDGGKRGAASGKQPTREVVAGPQTGEDRLPKKSTPVLRPISPLPRHRAKQRAGRRVRSSPLARRAAAGRGIDLARVPGSGPAGAVRYRDLTSPAQEPPAAAAARAEPGPVADRIAAARRVTAQLMSRSKREIPHYYLSATLDMTRPMHWLADQNSRRPVADRLIPAALILRATALAAARTPDLNGWFEDGMFQHADDVHLGVAVALRPVGLVTPAILNSQSKNIDEIMAALADLVARARNGRLRQSELSSATITVTNLGDQAVDTIYGVIYPPQVALVGCGRIIDRAYAHDGLIGIRPELVVTLSADHRVSDGRAGGRFLTQLGKLLQAPEEL